MTFPVRPNPAVATDPDRLATLAAVLPGAGLMTPMKTPDWFRACQDTLYPGDAC